jgi:hypothetical protein
MDSGSLAALGPGMTETSIRVTTPARTFRRSIDNTIFSAALEILQQYWYNLFFDIG